MATFKAEVQNRRKDGTYNVKIRVTHNRQKKYISTSLYVTDKELTRSLKIKDVAFKDATDAIIKQYRDLCNKHSDKLNEFTVQQVVDLITSKDSDTDRFVLDFIDYGRNFAQKLIETGHQGNGKSYMTALNALVMFVGREQVFISELTVKFINDFAEWIQNRPSSTKRVKGSRAVSHYLSSIRALYNRAKCEFNNEEMGIINIPYSPFSKVKVPKPPLTKKRALTIVLLDNCCRIASNCFSTAGFPPILSALIISSFTFIGQY